MICHLRKLEIKLGAGSYLDLQISLVDMFSPSRVTGFLSESSMGKFLVVVLRSFIPLRISGKSC